MLFSLYLSTKLHGATFWQLYPSQSVGTRVADSVYRGVFKRSQTESVTTDSGTLIIVHCYHLQSSPYLRLCNGPSIPATAGSIVGTGVLDFCVVMSAVSFLEMRRNKRAKSGG